MEGWLNQMAQFLDLWMIRIAVLSSFAAHLVLILLAGIRRHKASGGRTLLLWLAYQLANWAATYALGNLSFGCKSQEQQQLAAFWAPFLLQHLGGPDNISAYSLEDNVLSGRQALNVFVQVGGAIYVLYKHTYIGGGDGVLLPASIIILAVGVAKYVEKALALRRGNLGNIRSSSKKKKQSRRIINDGSALRRGRVDDEQALMVAHDMFPFCQRAMTDSSVDVDSPGLDTSRKIFSFGWENMCKVVEMELSLMYDILYTKAAMVHTWGGYLIRFVSPLATITAFFLFLACSKDGHRREDVIITYTLLAVTFLLDIRWLLSALGSTWTHAFLQARPLCWLHEKALGSAGRWYRLRRVVVSLDPRRLVLVRAPSRYRTWSGTIGQYSLLQVCTRGTTLRGRAAKKIGLEEGWNEHHHSRGLELSHDVKRLVFERVGKLLSSTFEDKDKDGAYSMNDITTSWGQTAAKRRHNKLSRFRLAFGREFQEDILVWHIATQVFLMCQSLIHGEDAHARAIKALSEYLMFLVAVRRHMLPGLVLRSLYEVTRDALQDIWSASSCSSATTHKEEMLARILHDKKAAKSEWGLENDETRLVSDGVNIAMVLLSADQSEMPELLELVFNVWVDKLLYAGTRCSRESHARQLSRGGELTTIVWILAEHAGPFQIGKRGPDHQKPKKPDAAMPSFPYPSYCPPYMYPSLPECGGLPRFPWMPSFSGPSVDRPPPPPPVDSKPPKGSRARTRWYATLYPVD